jgi:two-component system NtrC family sensor kinase
VALTPGRTLSSRVLAGFVILIAAFTATMVWIVSYVDDLRSEIYVIRTRYLRITIVAKDLAGQQHALFGYLKEEMPGEGTPTVVTRRIGRMRDARTAQLTNLRQTLASLRDLPRNHGQAARRYLEKVQGVERAITALDARYVELLAAPPIDRTIKADPPVVDPVKLTEAIRARDTLLIAENRLYVSLTSLADTLQVQTERTASNLERNAQRLRWFTGLVGAIAVVVGVLVTVWVTLSLRPLVRLRSAARRIAAGDYGSRIAEAGPAEVADLAREFNAMGRAVEEREREVVRAERLAAVGKMAAMITHEVRNPLSSIGLNTELLEDELPSGASEARNLCSAIHREVDRLTAITEEYLAFGRLPKPKLAKEPINTMVSALAAFVREDLATKKVTLVTELASGDPIAQVDGGQIRQCLINLVRNAADAVVAKGEGRVVLRTRVAHHGQAIEIDVEDNGTGITSDVLPKLFDPFFSTKEGGNGLGLALTQQIIRDHGGDLRVDSAVGRGTTFTVSVPASG